MKKIIAALILSLMPIMAMESKAPEVEMYPDEVNSHFLYPLISVDVPSHCYASSTNNYYLENRVIEWVRSSLEKYNPDVASVRCFNREHEPSFIYEIKPFLFNLEDACSVFRLDVSLEYHPISDVIIDKELISQKEQLFIKSLEIKKEQLFVKFKEFSSYYMDIMLLPELQHFSDPEKTPRKTLLEDWKTKISKKKIVFFTSSIDFMNRKLDISLVDEKEHIDSSSLQELRATLKTIFA